MTHYFRKKGALEQQLNSRRVYPESRNLSARQKVFLSATTLVFPHTLVSIDCRTKHMNLKIFVTPPNKRDQHSGGQ